MFGGRVTAGVSGYGEFESQIKAGKLRALAISSGKRLAGADVPTLKEQGMDVEVVNWRAIMAPPGFGGPAQGACRDRRQAGQVEGMGRDPQAARLGGFLPRGSALRSLPQGGTGSRRRHPEVDRPREVLRQIEGGPARAPSFPSTFQAFAESTLASTNRLKKDRANFHGSEVMFMSSAGERTVNGKRELTEGLACADP